MIDKTMRSLLLLTAMMGLTQSGVLGGEPLPARALARIGDHRFYHGPGIRCAVLSPDGSRAASAAANDPIIVLWDTATGERLRELPVSQGGISRLAFSPSGKQLAAACNTISDNKSRVVFFDVESGKPLRQLGDFPREICHLQFAANGEQLRVSEWDGPVSAWDASTGKQLKLWKPPSVPLRNKKNEVCATQGVLSPDGRRILWQIYRFRPGGRPDDGEIDSLQVYEADRAKSLYQKKFTDQEEFDRYQSTESFTISADGKRFAVIYDKLSVDKFIVWEAATGKELASLKKRGMVRFALAPDGRRAAIAEAGTRTEKSRLCLWNLETGKLTRELYSGFDVSAHSLQKALPVFSANGRTLLFVTHSALHIFDTKIEEERTVSRHYAPVTPRFAADGRTLFTFCSERKCTWDVSARNQLALFKHERSPVWAIGGLASSPDDRFFLDCPESRLRVCEAATGRSLCELEADGQYVISGQFSPNATRVLLSEARDRHVFRLYDAKTGKKSGEIKPVERADNPVFSPDGRFVAWGDRADILHLHNAVTGKVVRTLRSSRPLPKTEFANAVLFSPDGEYLLAEGAFPQPMRVFQISSGREISRFDAHSEAAHSPIQLLVLISCVAWSPDGRLVAVAEEHSGVIRLLEVASGKTRAAFDGHRHGIHGLAFAPDGQTLASGGEDNVVFLWDVTGAKTLAIGKQTPAEWWNDLASHDGKRAGVAIASLLRKPEASVAFIQQRLRPAEVLTEKQLARLLADLDSDAFETREAASRELTRLGERAEAALRRALRNRPSLEARRRIKDLLDQFPVPPPPETLRALRAIEVLEHAGTPTARRCLEALAKGASDARPTRAAKGALNRLAKRRK